MVGAEDNRTVVRDIVLDRFKKDLIGPKDGAEEVIDERPTARYLTGILYPQQTVFSEAEDERIDTQNGQVSAEDDSENEESTLTRSFKPAACGFSFNVEGSEDKAVVLTVSFARYREEAQPGGASHWRREAIELAGIMVPLRPGSDEVPIAEGLRLHRRVRRAGPHATVTLQFVNAFREPARGEEPDAGDPLAVNDRTAREEAAFCQFQAKVSLNGDTRFVPRPRAFRGGDQDERSADLLYRDFAEYAVGHTTSAEWFPSIDPVEVDLTWLPYAVVRKMDASGDPTLSAAIGTSPIGKLSAIDLAYAEDKALVGTLQSVTEGYERWIDEQSTRIHSEIPAGLRQIAEEHLEKCRRAASRIREGIDLVASDPVVAQAFRLANRAMYVQRAWGEGQRNAHRHDLFTEERESFNWRPFQLAFALMCLPSTIDRENENRDVFDLIWFPTGGGKTEAYLLLAAASLFHRRLTSGAAGVSVIMRYTLRTLTVQQFQRAASMLTACEAIRAERSDLGEAPLSIGLWVGSDSTPNSFDKAVEVLSDPDAVSTPRQLTKCPVCLGDVRWRADTDRRRITCECDDALCREERPDGRLEVLTVDDDLYASPPSLLIGTVDKFAQIVRKRDTAVLFGRPQGAPPPDLIIQDELHLISGPLGSLTGLYETAVDELCRNEKGPAKIVGSTATIRRAEEQVRSVFDRRTSQFPPMALDWSNSCFARLDENDAGRVYVGATTAGRSEKFTLQAAAASLLQSAMDSRFQNGDEADAYFTLVAYFNSLKVLGGALVLMEDDVRVSIEALATQRGETARQLETPQELTSRKPSSEIPEILEQLGLRRDDRDAVDVLLASNMLSVGVDIPRLGLMLVNGQPKFMAEYIQATSRVGREEPGLIITLYNNNKIRDRAHFETFASWHGALYRTVEPSSVTPFAPRARDKALHAPLVALVRHFVRPGGPGITTSELESVRLLINRIVDRVRRIDHDEAEEARRQLEAFVEDWLDAVEAGRLRAYWNDMRSNSSLLMSAEAAAARRAAGRDEAPAAPTPNSVRNVEPGVDFVLRETMRGA